ncbi:hypothetical protein PR048_017376 [Dryococelus australis]|uniref:Uncharacterized protein n=1 Tax=Dryococelus australis TaxID=614101 RepID=A0ABQ9H9B9_9NEOP|nr:hypothetical protein PR048_017376 [Dryococelus australis]
MNGPHQVSELASALERVIKLEQGEEIHKEICDIKAGRQISTRSRTRQLHPILDELGLLQTPSCWTTTLTCRDQTEILATNEGHDLAHKTDNECQEQTQDGSATHG